MPFTDDMIKEYLRRHGDVPFYVALLARLEAAENFIGGRTVICDTCDNVIGQTETDKVLYKAWRASRGEVWDGNAWLKAKGDVSESEQSAGREGR